MKAIISQQVVFFVARVTHEELVKLKELIEANTATAVIDRRYSFSEAAEAIRYLMEGHARGKVAVTMQHDH